MSDNKQADQSLWMVITASNGKRELTINVGDFVTPNDIYTEFYDHLGDYEIIGVYSNFEAIDFIDDNTVIDDVFDILEISVTELKVLIAWAYVNATHIYCETSKLIEGMHEHYIGSFDSETELAHWHVENRVDMNGVPDIIKRNVCYESIGADLLWMGTYSSANDRDHFYYFDF